MKKTITWVLVADGARARILRSDRPGADLAPVIDEAYRPATEPTRALGADRPGRVHDSADVGRHALEPRVDWHLYEKEQFARKMAAVVNRGARDGAFDRLVLVAPPGTLGQLRAALDKHASGRVVAELGKDLTRETAAELRSRLEEIAPL